MKIFERVLFAVSLPLVVAWFFLGHRALHLVEVRNSALRAKVEAARERALATSEGQSATSGVSSASGWKEIISRLWRSRPIGGLPDLRAMILLQQKIFSMDRGELAAALDEIATLEIDRGTRARFENALIGILIEKDPEMALTRYMGLTGDSSRLVGLQLSQALRSWMEKEPRMAIDWFDREISKGSFDSRRLDGRSGIRWLFEGKLVGPLLESDRAAASRRMSALSLEDRREALRIAGGDLKPEQLEAYMALVRESLPVSDHAGHLALQVTGLSYKRDYQGISTYLERTHATPAERLAAVERAAEHRFWGGALKEEDSMREALDGFRAWAEGESEGSADRVTGKALASALSEEEEFVTFAELAALAKEYHAMTGNDEILIPLADHWFARKGYREEARKLAELIADSAQRDRLLDKLK